MSIFLYIKRHRQTGMKYFGKTTRSNPYRYKGSGSFWRAHIKKHGDDIETLQVWKFDNQSDCTEFAIKFSLDNNIASSDDWANLIVENGLDGNIQGSVWYNNGISSKQFLTPPDGWTQGRLRGHNGIPKGYKWYTNGIESKMSVTCPAGWYSGSSRDKTTKNAKWYNNGVEQKLLFDCPDGWIKGQIKLVCPHCNMTGGRSMIKRYHFDHCKFKK